MMTWPKLISVESKKLYYSRTLRFVDEEILLEKKKILPIGNLFRAFSLTPFEEVNVVIVGEEPQSEPNLAHGLSHSVGWGNPINETSKAILEESGQPDALHCNLTEWTSQGVFLLNRLLTVEQGIPGAHKHVGWRKFTDKVIETLSGEKDKLVFLLWGEETHNLESIIDSSKHLILKAPSPGKKEFKGCDHFQKTNDHLKANGKKEVEWKLKLRS